MRLSHAQIFLPSCPPDSVISFCRDLGSASTWNLDRLEALAKEIQAKLRQSCNIDDACSVDYNQDLGTSKTQLALLLISRFDRLSVDPNVCLPQKQHCPSSQSVLSIAALCRPTGSGVRARPPEDLPVSPLSRHTDCIQTVPFTLILQL